MKHHAGFKLDQLKARLLKLVIKEVTTLDRETRLNQLARRLTIVAVTRHRQNVMLHGVPARSIEIPSANEVRNQINKGIK